jgi:hypothetical protein
MGAHLIQADATRLPLADASVDLVFTSPPYLCARTYGIAAQRDCAEWIDWMLVVVAECCRVSRGLVLVNCAGVTRDWCYRPGPEGLLYEWWKRGGQCWRPAYWHRVGIPGSGGKQWLRADVEYVLAFKGGKGQIPWADNTACGHPPKWGPGGEMSYRNAIGTRRNQWGKAGPSLARTAEGGRDVRPRPSHVFGNQQSSVGRRPNGTPKQPYFNGAHSIRDGVAFPVLANPGNLIRTAVGGNQMGSKCAHENEAPFPEALAEFFVKSFCPPGGRVLDPFSGSGTTVAVAERLGRVGIGIDLRMSQCELGRRRVIESRQAALTGKVKRPRRAKEPKGEPLLWSA